MLSKLTKIHNSALENDLKKSKRWVAILYILLSIIAIVVAFFVTHLLYSKMLLVLSGVLLGSNIEKLVTYHIRKSSLDLLSSPTQNP